MNRDTDKILDILVENISKLTEVQAVGLSGGKTPLPGAGEGDIDIFIYCDTIPGIEKRQALINRMEGLLQEGKTNVFEGGHWGTGDFALINGVETWLMYFTIDETLKDIEAILDGAYPDKLDNYYYPAGRCAMLQGMSILYDESGFLASLKKRLGEYPDKLAQILVEYHLEELEDTEDLERAAGRKDVLFYHFAMEIAIDHFLQALFAANRVFFPSRKRTLRFIESFAIKPRDCGERLLEAVRLGGFAEGIWQSYRLWLDIADELKKICRDMEL